MAVSKRMIFLAGAPEADKLDWSESQLLPSHHLADRTSLRIMLQSSSVSAATSESAKWRAIPFKTAGESVAQELPPEAQLHTLDKRNGTQLATGQMDGFLEHSIAVLEDLETSQIAAHSFDGTTFEPTASFNTSMVTDAFSTNYDSFYSGASTQPSPGVHRPLPGSVTDLKHISNAAHIERIAPQTLTVHLLAGIISVSPSRTVKLRRRKAEMDIIEILLGDETRAGFSISFWLAPVESQQKPKDDLRDTINKLRPGNVVFLQNVALSAFKGNVYGQSLSKRFARNSTSVTTLSDESASGQAPALSAKLNRVSAWVEMFVGVPSGGANKRTGSPLRNGRNKRTTVDLPPDTQE